MRIPANWGPTIEPLRPTPKPAPIPLERRSVGYKVAARALTADWPPTTPNPARKTTTNKSANDKPGWPINAMFTQPIRKHVVSTGTNPNRETNQPSTMAPTTPPTCNVVPTSKAYEPETPAALTNGVTTVGSQLDRK